MILAGGLLLVFLLGFLILLFWQQDFFFIELVGIGFALGLGLTTLLMFSLGIFRFPLTRENILFVLLLINLILYLLLLKKSKKINPLSGLGNLAGFKRTVRSLHPIEMGIGVFLTFIVAWSFLQTVVWPPYEWDALSLYDFRARRIAETHSLAEFIFTSLPQKEFITYNYSYPPFTSLVHAFVYLGGGENPQFIYTLAYLILLVCFGSCLARRVSRFSALALTLLLATTPSLVYHSIISYTNLFYTLFFALGTIYLWEWLRDKKTGYFVVSGLFLGLSCWTRSSEPFWMVNILFLVVYLLFKKKIIHLVFYLIVFFVIRQSWLIYQGAIFSQVEGLIIPQTKFFLDLAKIPDVFIYVMKNMVFGWRFLPFILLSLTLFFAGRRLIKFWYISGPIFFYLVMVFVGTYIFSQSYEWWNRIGGSLERMLMFFLPLIYYFLGLIFFAGNGKKFFTKPRLKIKLEVSQ